MFASKENVFAIFFGVAKAIFRIAEKTTRREKRETFCYY